MNYQTGIEQAKQLDQKDPLASFRDQFYIPPHTNARDEIYLVGNSLGLQPKNTAQYIQTELEKWQTLGVRGHFESDLPWLPYHEFLTDNMATIVGGQANEVVVMNSLTANLHFMMVSFYRPTKHRHKILIEGHAFPSDHYAVESQIKFHGFDPAKSLLSIEPRPDEDTLRAEDLQTLIDQQGESIALILLPGVQYYTGQVFDMASICELGHAQGCLVGFDLAHAAGNIPLALHDWQVDFACWCTYKYLNAGPGATGACFVHEQHVANRDLPRFAGWWGHNKTTRFDMQTPFDPIPSVESWQVSNAPIFSMAAINASLDIFTQAGGMNELRKKSVQLIQYLDFLLATHLPNEIECITPLNLQERGCQFSLRVVSQGKTGREVFEQLTTAGIACDWRYPNVIRIAPVPLYNRFEEVYHFVELLNKFVK